MTVPQPRPHSFGWASAMAEPFVPNEKIVEAWPRLFIPRETVQADVEPGEKTGIYYILLCNLPFGTTWQAIKAFTNCVCQVDYVQVFRSSTSGWVRVVGKDNFDKAWKRLDGGYFNGRSIIASDKNRTETIKIKELVGTPAPRTSREDCPTTPESRSTATSRCETPASLFLSPQGVTIPRGQPLPNSRRAVTRPPIHTPRPVAMSNFNMILPNTSVVTLGQAAARSRILHGLTQRSPLAIPPARNYGIQSSYPPRRITQITQIQGGQQFNARASIWNAPNSYAVTEPRKIFITPLARKAKAEEVIVWIHAKLGSYRSQITDIKIPHRGPWARIRGYAFVVFRDANTAMKAIAMLDRVDFRGCSVRARLATEGVVVCDSPPSVDPAILDIFNVRRYGIHYHIKCQGDSSSTRDLSSHQPENEDALARKNYDTSKPVIVDGSSCKKRADKQKMH